jgi:hypothetical protein
MKTESSVQKSQFSSVQPKTTTITPPEADNPLSGQAPKDGQANLGQDQAKFSKATPQHGSEPKQIDFEIDSESQTSNPAFGIQDWEKAEDTPSTQAVLDYVQEIEQKNIQSLLDGLDQSLERARKMLEENSKHYYAKVKPQIDALKKIVAEEKTHEIAQKSDEQRASKSQLAHLVGEIKNQLAAVINTNPELAQAFEKVLSQAQHVSEKPAH